MTIKASKPGAVRKHQKEPLGVALKSQSSSPCWPGDIRMRTLEVPQDCRCVWSVVEAGAGLACVSRLKFANAMCPARHPRA